MKFEEIKNNNIKKCKNFIWHDQYLVGFTGKRILLFDSNLDLLNVSDNLSYVYSGDISLQGNKLLSVSTENKFYIHEFPSLKLIDKITLKSPYNYNLEGNGRWSLDGEKILICAQNSETLNSVLRIYNSECLSEYFDLLIEKYWLMSIERIEKKNKFMLIGFSRDNFSTYLIWYDRITFEEFCLKEIDVSVLKAKYNKLYDCIEIYSDGLVMLYDCKGNLIGKSVLSASDILNYSFSEVFDNKDFDKSKFSQIESLSSALGLENISIRNQITDICIFKDNAVAYIATMNSVKVYDIEKKMIITEISIPYGVQKVDVFSDNKIIISTWEGIRIFEFF